MLKRGGKLALRGKSYYSDKLQSKPIADLEKECKLDGKLDTIPKDKIGRERVGSTGAGSHLKVLGRKR